MEDEHTRQLLVLALAKDKSVAVAVPVDPLTTDSTELVSDDELQTMQAVVVAL